MSKIKLSEPNKCDKNGWAPIHLFAANGRNNLITKFVAAGADINSVIITDEPSMSVLAIVLAIRGGHTDTAMLLAKLGADINSADKDGTNTMVDLWNKYIFGYQLGVIGFKDAYRIFQRR
jgi:ankyrin repeat protein